jgi:succinoglycan biosynthesis transport protein ExoP
MMRMTDHSFGTDFPETGGLAATAPQPRLLDVLMSRKRLILSAAVAGTAIFSLYACLATPTYTAEALVVTNQPEFGQEASPLAASRETQVAALLSEIDAIRSPAFVARVVEQYNLTSDPEFKESESWFGDAGDAKPGAPRPGSFFAYAGYLANNALADIRSLIGRVSGNADTTGAPPGWQHDVAMAQTVRAVSRHLTVSNDGHSVTIDIRFWSEDPYKASKLANAFASNYVKGKLEINQDQSAQINTWLEGQIGVLRDRVVAAGKAVQEARQRLNISEAGAAGTLSDQTLLQWNNQLVAAQTARLQAEARLATAKRVLSDKSPKQSTTDVLNSPLIQRLREQKGILTGQYASMVSRSGANYPPAVALKREIDDLSESLWAETDKILDSLANEVKTAELAEKVVQGALSAAEKRANASQMDLSTIRELEQRETSERALYDQFLRKFNETLGRNYFPQTDVRTISPAAVPDRPSYPRLILFAPAGFLLGMFFGVVKALHSVGADRTFKASWAVEAATGLPVIGLVPVRRSLESRSRSPVPAERYFDQSVSRVLAILDQLGRSGQQPKVVAITSALPKEGKSTFCGALARSATRSGKRVLVIEFDRHFPSLAEIFHNPANTGDLMDLIAGTKTLDDVVQRDAYSPAEFVPICNRNETTQQIISSARMHAAFEQLRSSYDLILIDTAPVLANADIAALTEVIDTSLVVIRWGSTPKEAVAAAIRQLRLLNLPVAGIVMTAVDPAQADSDAEGKFYNQITQYHQYRGPA